MEFISIKETLEKIKLKKISALELSKIFIQRIKDNKNLNAFIYFNEDLIYEQVKRIEKFSDELSLKGIPLAIKDLFCTKNMPTTAGSKILSNFNSTYESYVTQKLLNEGSIFLGKYTPEAIGDYVAGPNHVLPTSRSARYSSGLGVLDFLKKTTFTKCNKKSLQLISNQAIKLAEAEGLYGHALSIYIRKNN